LTPKDLFFYQTIGRLSVAIAERASSLIIGEQGMLTGSSGLLPIQQWYLDKAPVVISHFNQSVLLGIDKSVTAPVLNAAIKQIILQHDALRFTYYKMQEKWEQVYGAADVDLLVDDFRSASTDELPGLISEQADKHQRSLDIEKGELIRIVWMQTPEEESSNRLLIVIHHLGVDGVSWRILLEDLEGLLNVLINGGKIDMGAKGTSYRQWYDALQMMIVKG
jgi:hypothetical protein